MPEGNHHTEGHARSRRWLFILDLVYLGALIGAAVARGAWSPPDYLAHPFGAMPLSVPWFGAVGAVLLSLEGIADHADDWKEGYNLWHIARPAIGAAFAVVAYLSLSTVIKVTTTSAPNNAYVFDLAAFIVGYREQTFRSLLRRVSDVIIGPDDSSVKNSGAKKDKKKQ